jgi:anti-anti-sigma factor
MAQIFQVDIEGARIVLRGRFDAAQETRAREIFESFEGPGPAIVDFSDLKYISSAGLGVLFALHKRLLEEGSGVRIVNPSPHILEIFKMVGFDKIFEIESAE